MPHCCNLPPSSIYNFFNADKTIINMSNYLSKNSSLVSYLITLLPCVKCVSDSNRSVYSCLYCIWYTKFRDLTTKYRENSHHIMVEMNYFHFYWHIRFKNKKNKNSPITNHLKQLSTQLLRTVFPQSLRRWCCIYLGWEIFTGWIQKCLN